MIASSEYLKTEKRETSIVRLTKVMISG